jgi:hypothetical protein
VSVAASRPIPNQYLVYETPALSSARAVREQVDWNAVRERCDQSPYARAFLVLLEELHVIARR